MQLTVTTWNINSVRLRIDSVAKFIKAVRPDVLCLQETKCPDDRFPLKRFKRLGYEHVALNGQKGYHGVVVLSRLPFESFNMQSFCGKTDCRHVAAVLGERAGLRDPITLHNFYVPAGGDIPDPAVNPKFAHKLSFLDEMRALARAALQQREPHDPGRRPQRRAARARRVEPQADAARGVAHADRMREARRRAEGRRLGRRHAHAGARTGQALHVVELSLARLGNRRQRPPPRSHLGRARARRSRRGMRVLEASARLVAAVRPRPGDGDAGGVGTPSRLTVYGSSVDSPTRISVLARRARRDVVDRLRATPRDAPPASRAAGAPLRGSCPAS